MQNEPKISLPEAFLLVSYIAITDIIGIVLIFFGLDDFFILDILTFPVTQLYFRIKGVRGTYGLAANVLELIPYVGALPIRTAGVLAVIWLDHHPEQAKKLQIVQKIKKPKGSIPAPANIKQ